QSCGNAVFETAHNGAAGVKQELSVYALRAFPVRDHVGDFIERGFERADHVVDAVNQTPDNVFTCGDEEVFQITHCGLDLTGQSAHTCDQLLNLVSRGGYHVAEERSDATWDGFEVEIGRASCR